MDGCFPPLLENAICDFKIVIHMYDDFMKLMVFSDLHLEFADFVPDTRDADVVVLAGDIHVGTAGIEWAKATFAEKPVVYVAGNHEYYRQTFPDHLEKMRLAASGSNVRFLENDSVDIDGIRFLGCTLWTDFHLLGDPPLARLEAESRMNDYRLIRTHTGQQRLRTADTLACHKQSVQWLREELARPSGKATVVITHHAPSLQSVRDPFKKDILSASYASACDDWAAASGAKLWIHGHVHRATDYHLGETRVVCNPRGYPGEDDSGFQPGFILSV